MLKRFPLLFVKVAYLYFATCRHDLVVFKRGSGENIMFPFSFHSPSLHIGGNTSLMALRPGWKLLQAQE